MRYPSAALLLSCVLGSPAMGTKALTAAAISTLVDEKKVTWDEPVRTYLPRLAFNDRDGQRR